VAELFIGLTYLLTTGIMLGAFVFIVVLAWRFMRAHEKIAQSLGVIAENIKASKEIEP